MQSRPGFATGLLLDLPDQERATLWLQSIGGACHRVSFTYHFPDASSRPAFRRAATLPCERELLTRD